MRLRCSQFGGDVVWGMATAAMVRAQAPPPALDELDDRRPHESLAEGPIPARSKLNVGKRARSQSLFRLLRLGTGMSELYTS